MLNIVAHCSNSLAFNNLQTALNTPPTTAIQPPPFPLSESVARQLTRSNYKLHDKNGDGEITVSYKFLNASDTDTSGLVSDKAKVLSADRKEAFRRSIQAWEDVIKVKFTENAKEADSFLVVHGQEGTGGYATYPTSWGDSVIGIGVDNTAQLDSSMIHELGHSLGLEHPNENYSENSHAYTAMSYNNKWWRPFDKGNTFISENPSTPMMHDIAAGQRLYAPNHGTRTENTTYGFNSNTQRKHYSLTSAEDQTAFCVWDGGGNDTLDFSGFNQDQNINLNAEKLSDVGGRTGNVSIAKGVVIENAIGGSGHDVIVGNSASNRITGGLGSDKLSGGDGSDIFVYHTASDSPPETPDILTDFTSGVDKIDLSNVLKNANIQTPKFVDKLTGEKGQITLSYDEQVNLYKLILDVNGNANSVLLILSEGPIKPEDLLTSTDSQTPVAPPTPVPCPTDKPELELELELELEPEPEPEPEFEPEPQPQPQTQPEPESEPKPTPIPGEVPARLHEDDTVYGFNSNTGRAASTLTSEADKPYFTVHDNIGKDTLDFSGFAQNQRIDLMPGSSSSVGGLIDNVQITPGTLIENAIGGKGNDRILGNAADNILTGGAGGDFMAGEGGFNTFRYLANSDSTRNNPDLLFDFTSGKDKIDLSKLSENEQVTLNYVNQYRGKAGDTILMHNPTTNRYFLGIDLTGDRKTDFLIKSTRPISSEDVIGLTIENDGYL